LATAPYIPDANIEAWNPENREMDSKVVGKNLHLDALRKRIDPKMKKAHIVLFDDSDRNIVVAAKSGYAVQAVEPARSEEEDGPAKGSTPTGFCQHYWTEFLKAEQNRPAKSGGCALL